jgi:hypothetical protein
MKKFMGKSIAIFIILMVAAGSAYAWNATEHVKAAPNGKGDLIIYPFYFSAEGGWETKLTVVNTDTVNSVVAKVVFRSHYYSEELLDFLIYLTPADVWTGSVRNDGAGAYIYSEDDSMLKTSSVWASATNPVSQSLYDPTCTSVDSDDYGYIEVIESWYGQVSAYHAAAPASHKFRARSGERTTRPVSKTLLRRIYDDWAGIADETGAIIGGSPTVDGTILNGDPGYPKTNALSTDHTINVLSATYQLLNPMASGMAAGVNASVFADYDCQEQLNTAVVTGLQTVTSRNTLGEIEAAMAKDNLAMPYVNDPASGEVTVHILTFPTKISQTQVISAANGTCNYKNGRGPFWIDRTVDPNVTNDRASVYYRNIRYFVNYYDLEEKTVEYIPGTDPFSGDDAVVNPPSTLPQEVNLILTSDYEDLFVEGWTNYTFDYTSRPNTATGGMTDFCPKDGTVVCTDRYNRTTDVWDSIGTYQFTGTPALSLVVKFTNGGIKMMQGAYTDGYVYDVGTDVAVDPASFIAGAPGNWLNDYQTFNILNEKGLESF